MSSGFAVIVDPYSSGVLVTQEFKRRGVDYLIVQSTPVVPEIYRSSAEPDESAVTILHNGNLAQTLAELRQFPVQCVIPGCDLGVGLADELGEGLGLPGNDPHLKQARLSKFLMTERVREQGLRVPAQFQSVSRDEILAWARFQNRFPLVLKPLNSTSSDGVYICSSDREIRDAFDRIISKTNVLGRNNRAALVQEFLDGTEYFVDTVSFAGQHRAAAFWKYRKSNSDVLAGPECIEHLPYHGEIQQALFAYAQRVLDALGLRYGAAHIEIMWCDGEPILIELGARVNGGKNPLISLECTGNSQIQLLADAYLESERFCDEISVPYSFQKSGMRVFLIPRCKGEYRNVDALKEPRALASFHEMYVGSRTSWDAPRRIGWVILVHADADVVERDFRRIRELEETEIYTR